MRRTNLVFLLLLVLFLPLVASCVKKWEPLMSAELISATTTRIDLRRTKRLGKVEQEYCFSAGEESSAMTYKNGDATIGLVDEVVARAQKSRKANAIADAYIEHSGNCVRITGTAVKARSRRGRRRH